MSNELELRLARAEDDAAIGELLVSSFVDAYATKLPEVVVSERRKAELRDVAAKRAVAQVWVALRRQEVVGTVALWPPGAQRSEAWISGAADLRHLAVARSSQGSGVSTKLLDAAEGWAWSQRVKAICLHVRRGAAGVRALYERRGYLRTEEGDIDALPEVYLEAFVLARA